MNEQENFLEMRWFHILVIWWALMWPLQLILQCFFIPDGIIRFFFEGAMPYVSSFTEILIYISISIVAWVGVLKLNVKRVLRNQFSNFFICLVPEASDHDSSPTSIEKHLSRPISRLQLAKIHWALAWRWALIFFVACILDAKVGWDVLTFETILYAPALFALITFRVMFNIFYSDDLLVDMVDFIWLVPHFLLLIGLVISIGAVRQVLRKDFRGFSIRLVPIRK